MTITEKVKNLVNDKGVMKSHLADKIGIDRSQFSAFLGGRIKLKSDKLLELDDLIDSYYFLPTKEEWLKQ